VFGRLVFEVSLALALVAPKLKAQAESLEFGASGQPVHGEFRPPRMDAHWGHEPVWSPGFSRQGFPMVKTFGMATTRRLKPVLQTWPLPFVSPRFMENFLFLSDLLTGHELKMRKSLIINDANLRFMGRAG
jgi:hypothetical protein